MKRSFFNLFLLFSCTLLMAQEAKDLQVVTASESLVGYWILEKAVLNEAPLYNPEQKTEKVYSFSQLNDESLEGHFLLNAVIMSIKYDENDSSSYVKFRLNREDDPEFEISDYPELFVFSKNKEFLIERFKIVELSEQMVLTSGEIFYNQGRTPMKAEMVLYLNKQ